MSRSIKSLILAVILILILTSLAVVFAAPLVTALPGEIRARMPQEILRAVTTPLPSALPAPHSAKSESSIVQTAAAQPPAATETPRGSITSTPTSRASSARQTPYSPLATPTIRASSARLRTLTPTRHLPLATRIPATRHSPLPSSTYIDGLTIEPQKLNNCGPANLSINLNYYDLDTTQFDVAGKVKPHYDDRNVSPEELVAYVNEETDLNAAVFRGGDLLLLKRLLAADFPVVIEKGYEPDDWQGWMGHYLTLIGYDEQSQTFSTMDTYLGPWDSSGRDYPYEDIANQWHHFNNTFFIIYPPEDAGKVKEILGENLTNQMQMWQGAVSSAQEGIEVDAQDPFAWFNLGSSLTEVAAATGDPATYSQAAAAFDQARLIGLPHRMLWYQFQPYIAYLNNNQVEDVLILTAAILDNPGGTDIEETFYYRGLAFRALGEEEKAVQAFHRALELKPHFKAAQNALAENEPAN